MLDERGNFVQAELAGEVHFDFGLEHRVDEVFVDFHTGVAGHDVDYDVCACEDDVERFP